MSYSPEKRNSTRSIRRGPTIRGRSYRSSVSRKSEPGEDEESLALNPQQDNDPAEIDHAEYHDQETAAQEKLELYQYRHGDETFGDVITHPIEQYKEHRYRKQHYAEEVEKWKKHVHDSTMDEANEKKDFIIVVHFRQLRANQGFVLDHDKVEEFAAKIGMTPQERIQFNGVRDSDGLTAFLYRNKREFSIKIHHKAEIARHSGIPAPHSNFEVAHALEHNPDNHIIEFNENIFVEFKPRRNMNLPLPPPEFTRRPFFRYPEPDLSADVGEEEPASWLELFYDLFYVATLTEFTHSHHFMDWAALGLYAQWFILTWWAWFASSLYTARFDTDDVVHHIYKLIEMCAVIGMAGSSDYFLNSRGYVYGYIALKGVLVIEYSVVFVVALLARSKSRIALAFYVGANLVSIALWASSIAIIDSSTHRVLWYLGISVEIIVNVIVRSDKSLTWAASNLAERLGLLTLIVFGENLMGLVRTVAGSGSSFYTMIPNFMAVVIIFGYFFMYFEDFNKEVFLHAKFHQIWVYLHFPLHLCQVAFGISLIDTIRIYKEQMGYTSEGPGTGAGGAETGGVETGGAETGGAETGGHETGGTGAGGVEPAHKLARRAIASVNPDVEEYNPSVKDTPVTVPLQPDTVVTPSEGGVLTHGTAFIGSFVMAGLQAIAASENLGVDEQPLEARHHLVRRAPAEGGEELPTTQEQRVFIYKTFFICSGLLLVINSLIKMINTRISDLSGKIIIGSRIINAIFLWCMCALPFSRLDAIVLLSVLMGSLILQAMIDLLD